MEATILNTKVIGLKNIIECMYYEGVELCKLDNGKTIEVYDNGTYETY